MGLSRPPRTRASVLFLILVTAAISGARDNRVLARQEPAPAQRWDGLIELISGHYQYAPPSADAPIPADGPSEMSRHAISADGRYIVFTANAPSLGYSTTALYLRDRRTGETRVLLGGPALDAVISGDGNHIAFKVCDPWMRPDQLPICDVYALDQRNWAWTLISEGADGEHGDADSVEPAISANGRFVVYQTTATNILGGASAVQQLVLRDRDPDGNGVYDELGTSVNEIISVGFDGQPANGDSATAEVSDDGRFVAFRSLAGNLAGASVPGTWHVFRRDRQSQHTTWIDLRPDGYASLVPIDSPKIAMSADGRVIVFASEDPTLTWGYPDDTNGARDIFVYEEDAQPRIRRIDIGQPLPIAQGRTPGNGPSEWPSISADGRYVAFQSAASNADVANPGTPGSTQVYVFDRVTGTPARISVKPDGTDPDAGSVRPEIARDGSLVTFISQSLNLSPNVQVPLDRIYAAVHLEITPAEVTVPGSGGAATFTITTQQHTMWWVDWTQWYSWIWFETPPMGVGSGTLSVTTNEANPEPVRRTADIRIHDRTAKLTQLEGLSMTSVTPSAGPSAGGTSVTIRGTGFEPGTLVEFGGLQSPSVQIVDSTRIVATTPAHETGTVWVAVFSPDFQRVAWMDQSFRFLDGTPPQIYSWIDGNLGGDGYYTSNATVNWWFWDEQTEVTSTSGCAPTTVTTDTAGTTFTCTATSEGGTSSASVTVKRDTTPPEVQIVTPARTIYRQNSTVTPELICNDSMSGMAQCGELPSPVPIVTDYPGWQTYHAFGLDKAGNFGFKSAEYAVSTGACLGATPGLKLWFEFDGSTKDSVHGSPFGGSWPQYAAAEFVPGMVGQALALADWRFFNFNHQLDDVNFSQAMTFAAWVRADGEDGEAGVIASKEDQFRIARFADGTIRWAFNNASPGYAWVNTNAVMPKGVWTHLVVTYDNGVVKTYLNGQLAHTHEGAGPIEKLTGLPFWGPWLSLGNRHDPAHESALIGAIDEVQFLDVAWNDAMVEALFFAGPDGMCRLTPTVTLAALSTTTFGSSSYQARAQLRVGATQTGVPGRTLRLVSYVSPNGVPVGTVTAVTDADGWATWDAPMRPTAPVSTYASGFRVFFDSDIEYGGSTAFGEVTVQTATPVVTWPAPQPISYGTPITTAQLNATANVPGVFFYSHLTGTVLPPGTHTLSVTFDPTSSNFRNANASVTLVVTKVTPSLTWNPPPAIVYGTPLGASQLNAAANVPGTWSYAPGAGTLLNAGAGQTLTATFTPADTTLYESASVTTTIDVAKATPTLTWSQPAPIVYGEPLSPSIFAATSSVPGTFTYAPEAGTRLNAGNAQTLTATFVPADSSNYNGGSVSTTIDVAKAPPSVIIAGGSYGYDGGAHPANAAAMGVFGEDLTPLNLTYNGSSSAPVNAGTYEAVATFAGNENYATASATATITIAKAPLGLNWTSPGAIVYGTPLGAAHLNATANVPGTFSYSPAAGAVLDAGTAQTLTATFTPADPVNYDGGVVTTTIGVAKATPVVVVTGGSFTYDGTAHAASATVTGVGGASLGPVTITYAGSTSAPVNAGNYLALASYAGSQNYESASEAAALTIGKAQAVVTWPAPAAIVYGTALGAAQLDASASVAGSFSYSPAPGTVLTAGNAHALSVVFTPADAANYVGAQAATTIDVLRAPLAVRANDAVKMFGAPLPAFVASAAGFVNGDSFASLGGAIVFATTATQQGPVGTYPIVPSGLTSANYTISFVTGTLSVIRGSTVVSVTTAPSPSGNNEPMTFSATVAAVAPAAGQPTGTVRFFDGTTLIGSATLSAGQASLTTAGLDPGIRTIEALYDGDNSFEAATRSITHVIQNAAGTPALSISSSRNPSNLGQTVTLTANISFGSGSVSGTIEFYDGGTLIGSSTIAAGRATLTTSALPAGSHAITARYTGVGDVPPSRSPVFVQAVGASGWKDRATTIALSSSGTPSTIDAPVVFTADVAGSSGSMPNGRILFMVNGQVVGDPAGVAVTPLSGSTARAAVTVTGLKYGRHRVTATYLGDPNYKGSTVLVTQTVN